MIGRFPRRERTRPMQAIRPTASARRKPAGPNVTLRDPVFAPGVTEARGQARSQVASGSLPYLDSYKLQRDEERERTGGRHGASPGVDTLGRTRSDRAAWMSVLRGFALAGALLEGEARAVTLVEPTATAPCETRGGVLGCVVVIRSQSYWFKPDNLCGGGRHVLPDLALAGIRASELPVEVSASCYGPGGWGPAWRGSLTLEPVHP